MNPPTDDPDVKDLFTRLAAAGAGRQVDAEGFPPGPWTAEQLARAISQIGENRSGIELRTVQLWFQDNQKGISAQNIRWLARIFGCGDTHATAEWQVALTAAQARMTSKRRETRSARPTPEPMGSCAQAPASVTTIDDETNVYKTRSLALRTDALFKGPSLTLPIIVWVCCGTLWFVAYATGIHDITYEISTGLAKQVGLFWSPSWILGEMILLPIALLLVSDLVKNWKEHFRDALARDLKISPTSWEHRLDEHQLPFKLILAVCAVGIFLLQWIGVYLLPFINGETDSTMVDWLLVAIERPDIISAPTAMVVSFIAFLYSGLIYWLYFTSLLVLHIIVSDFFDLISLRKPGKIPADKDFAIAERILFTLFRCTTLGILIAISIKLNAAYLISDAESITAWLVQDAFHPFIAGEKPWLLLYDDASPFFTSFLLLVLTCSVFLICVVGLLQPLVSSVKYERLQDIRQQRLHNHFYRMVGLLVFLSVCYLFAARFYGFSVLTSSGVMIGLLSLRWKPQIPFEDTNSNGRSATI